MIDVASYLSLSLVATTREAWPRAHRKSLTDQAFDDFPVVARFEPAELTQAFADQAGSCHSRVPLQIELADHEPHVIRRCRKFDGARDGLYFGVRRGEVRKHLRGRHTVCPPRSLAR